MAYYICTSRFQTDCEREVHKNDFARVNKPRFSFAPVSCTCGKVHACRRSMNSLNKERNFSRSAGAYLTRIEYIVTVQYSLVRQYYSRENFAKTLQFKETSQFAAIAETTIYQPTMRVIIAAGIDQMQLIQEEVCGMSFKILIQTNIKMWRIRKRDVV